MFTETFETTGTQLMQESFLKNVSSQYNIKNWMER